MDRSVITNCYRRAALLGMKPYELDDHIVQNDVFFRKDGVIMGVNKWKYIYFADKFLNETRAFLACN